ncbi:ferric reductase [Acrocarpospora pleiomorpha]|uniref:Ferric reductase n=1 Tax=Acrocarpospora pleiomorpha TaxID=90975 RepID=A0A5M3XV60_9ACTN|nr:ferric reductase-like transmembrane domain-containing protein [Acrocarpospora pleiomorpha]GES23193.1 ferric reductase [Acrocarpospora pleiomorpha]
MTRQVWEAGSDNKHATPSGKRTRRTPPPRARQANPDVVLVLICVGAAAATARCWASLSSVVGAVDWLAWAGRLSGLLAGYACAILLALMARIPSLDRGVGTDRLARWHATGGRWTITLSVAHMMFVIAAHSVESGLYAGTIHLLANGEGVWEATIGLALLVGVAVVSARGIRRLMRYEIWHYLHFFTYIAVFAAFTHQLTGPDFAGGGLGRLLWLALYIGVAAALLWFRFLSPVRRALRHRLRITEIRWESPTVISVYLSGAYLNELGAEPGQFFRWRFLAPGMWWTANPYSLSAPVNPRYLRITVKAVGDHSRALTRLRPGTRVVAEGPYGGLTAARRRGERVLLIGGGVGISPLRTLFETMPGQVTLVYMARRDEDLVLRDELDEIAARRGGTVLYTLDESRVVPLTGRALRVLIPGLAEHDVYICGPTGMTMAARNALRRAGVPSRRIHLECFDF